jgi:hypothetical protein
MAQIVVRALPRIRQLVIDFPPPFIAIVARSGKVNRLNLKLFGGGYTLRGNLSTTPLVHHDIIAYSVTLLRLRSAHSRLAALKFTFMPHSGQ